MEELARANGPLSIAELARALGVHRSIAYRIIRTLEDHRLIRRTARGVELGVGLVELARSVTRGWEDTIRATVRSMAEQLAMTTYIAVRDGSDCVVVMSEEPRSRDAVVTYHPGYRHPLTAGADGKAIQAALITSEWEEVAPGILESDEVRAIAARGYASSTGEVISGVSAVAIPMRIHAWGAGALSVVFVDSPLPPEELARRLTTAAAEIQRFG